MTSILIPGPSGDSSANLVIKSTSHITVPSGNSAQRDISNFNTIPGCLRYNETTSSLEYYKLDTWEQILSTTEIDPTIDYNKFLFLNTNGQINFESINLSKNTDVANYSVSANNILISDGNTYNSKIVSGDITLTSDGTTSINSSFFSNKDAKGRENSDYLLVIDSTDSYKKITIGTLISGLASSGEIPSSLDWTAITGKPSFATVSTSGSYTDLSNVPAFSNVAFTGSYNSLTDKPTIDSGIGFNNLSASNANPNGLGSLSYDNQGNFVYTPANYTVTVNAPSGTGNLTYANGVFSYTPPDLSVNQGATDVITGSFVTNPNGNLIINSTEDIKLVSFNNKFHFNNFLLNTTDQPPNSNNEGEDKELRITETGFYYKVNDEWYLLQMNLVF